MPTQVQINAESQFDQFVRFAEHAAGKAIARVGGETTESVPSGKISVRAIDTATDDKVYATRRSQANKTANDDTRTMFMNTVADMFGGKDRIPDSVLKKMNMKDFGQGKPLTARRIMAVKRAVVEAQTKMRQANLWLDQALKRHAPAKLSEGQKQQTATIIAKYANSLYRAGGKVRGYIIDNLIDLVADPKLGPHADDLFALIPWDLKSLRTFTLDDVREMAPNSLLE